MEKLFLEILDLVVGFLPYFIIKIVGVTVLIILWPKLIKYFLKFMRKVMVRKKIDDLLESFVESLLSTLGYVIMFFMIISILGVKTTSLVALLGTAGLAVGLALQGSLSNLAGGVLILFFRQFSKGDYIATTTAKVEGTVISIRILYTTLLNANNQTIIVPNSQLANASVINFSTHPERRLDLTYSASYDNDVDVVIATLTKIAKNHPKILQNQPITVRLKAHNASSLDYAFRAYTLQEDYWTTIFDCNETVRKEFAKAGIEIPYNKLDLYTK